MIRTPESGLHWRQLLAKPDPQLADAGHASELLMAATRIVIAVLIAGAPLGLYGGGALSGEGLMLLVAAALALFESGLVYVAAERHIGWSWIGFASSVLDVSLVSLALAFALRHLGPEEIAHPVLFPAYLLVIGATSLRYDARICLAAGASALLEYSCIALGIGLPVGLTVARLLLLVAATSLASALVLRSRELRTLAISDRLTGLSNRGYFDERLKEELAEATRTQRPLGVILLDVDHFKFFNDTHGHRGGDEALRSLAQLLKESFRATDIVARYGGEELAVVMPGCSPVDLLRRSEALRKAVETMHVRVSGRSLTASLTVSMGVASWPEDGRSVEEVVQRADERLYEAKRLGRNRVLGPQSPGLTPRFPQPPALA